VSGRFRSTGPTAARMFRHSYGAVLVRPAGPKSLFVPGVFGLAPFGSGICFVNEVLANWPIVGCATWVPARPRFGTVSVRACGSNTRPGTPPIGRPGHSAGLNSSRWLAAWVALLLSQPAPL